MTAAGERAFTRPGADETVTGAVRRYDRATLLRALRRMSLLKTAYCTVRFRSLVVVARGVRLSLPRGAVVEVRGRGALVLGVDQNRPSHSVLEIHRGGRLVVDGIVSVCRGAKLVVASGASLHIGGGTYFNDGCTLTVFAHSRIGRSTAVAWNVTITDTDMHQIQHRGRPAKVTAPVTIGDNVWIGAHAIVLKGVTIGDGAVVGAGSVVSRDVEPRTLVSGNPATKIADDVSWQH